MELEGFNTLLMGPAGTGKTHSIGTLVDTGIEVFYLALSPGQETLVGYYIDKHKPIPPNLHLHYIRPQAAGFREMMEDAKRANTLPHDALAKMMDPNRSKYTGFISLLNTLDNFIDQRTGEEFGPVDSWGPERALVLDEGTSLARMSMQNIVGGKITMNVGEYGQGMNQIEFLLDKLTNGCRCSFIYISHIERELDPVLGGTKISPSTLGGKLAPKIPGKFSDVILTKKDGAKFFWDTSNSQADVKYRNLPMGADLRPDFAQIVEKWRSRAHGVENE